MTAPRNREKDQERQEARATDPEDKLPTYQELVDEGSDDSFPASDPPATSAATHTARPVQTARDDQDWTLQPAGDDSPHHGEQVVAEFDDEDSARRAQQQVLQAELPTARLDLAPREHPGRPAATVTVVACDDEQRDRALAIVRDSGAAQVSTRPLS
jgi:hypothetical protein